MDSAKAASAASAAAAKRISHHGRKSPSAGQSSLLALAASGRDLHSGLRADWEMVFREAARLDKAVEIDAYPDRQDLNLSLLKIVKRCGTRISMGKDAHHPWQFEFIDLALVAALTAKIPPERIVNFMPLTELHAWVEKVRRAEARRICAKAKR